MTKQNTDEETVSLVENCNFVKEFLNSLEERGAEGLTNEAAMVIKELQGNMLGFLKVSNPQIEDPGTEKVSDKLNPAKNIDAAKVQHETSVSHSNKGIDLKHGEDVRREEIKIKSKVKHLKNLISSDESDTSSQSSSEESENNSKPPRRKEKVRKESDSQVADILRQMDNRQVPKLENFLEDSGQSLNKYLDRFESYCRQNFKGNEEFWLSELENHLEGKMLESYKLLRDYDDNYYDVKIKLLRFYKDSSKLRKRRFKKKFENARPKHKESLYSFSIRLENLYKSAYPNKQKDVQQSSKLINQLKKAVSRETKNALSSQIITCKLKGEKPTWKFIQECIRYKDLDDGDGEDDSRSDEDMTAKKEVVINLGRYDNRYDKGRTNQREYQSAQQYYPTNERMMQNRQNNDYQRFNQIRRPEMKVCHTCKRFGHFAKECRVTLRQCLLCGDSRHFVKDCPNRGFRYGRSNYRNDDYRRNDRRARSYSQNRPNGSDSAANSYNRKNDHQDNNVNVGRMRRNSVGGYRSSQPIRAPFLRSDEYNKERNTGYDTRNEYQDNCVSPNKYENPTGYEQTDGGTNFNQVSHMNPNANSYYPKQSVNNSNVKSSNSGRYSSPNRMLN